MSEGATKEKKAPKPVELNETETAIADSSAMDNFSQSLSENIPQAQRDRFVKRAELIATLSNRLAIKAARARHRFTPKAKTEAAPAEGTAVTE